MFLRERNDINLYVFSSLSFHESALKIREEDLISKTLNRGHRGPQCNYKHYFTAQVLHTEKAEFSGQTNPDCLSACVCVK